MKLHYSSVRYILTEQKDQCTYVDKTIVAFDCMTMIIPAHTQGIKYVLCGLLHNLSLTVLSGLYTIKLYITYCLHDYLHNLSVKLKYLRDKIFAVSLFHKSLLGQKQACFKTYNEDVIILIYFSQFKMDQFAGQIKLFTLMQ